MDFSLFGFALGAIIGLILAAVRQPLLDLYQVSPEARAGASAMLLVAGLMLWLRSLDPMLIVGILRSGGDTRHAALLAKLASAAKMSEEDFRKKFTRAATRLHEIANGAGAQQRPAGATVQAG